MVDFASFPRIYNGKKYQIAVTIFNPHTGYQFLIPEQNILKIIVNNDLDTMFPTCSIDIVDLQGNYTRQLTQYGEYLQLIIAPPESTETEKNQKYLELVFLITNHVLHEFNYKQLTYTLTGVHHNAHNLNAHINYSTDTFLPKVSPYKIIADLLNLVKLPLADAELPVSDNPIHFITDQNNTVKQDILYCLNMACSEQHVPSYLFYHMLDQEYVLFNKDYILKNDLYVCNTTLDLINEEGNDNLTAETNIDNPNLYSSNEGLEYFQKSGLLQSYTYNHLKRTWSINDITSQEFDDVFNREILANDGLKSIYVNTPYEDFNIQFNETNFEKDLYFRLHDLEVGSNCMEFTVNGNLVRECGQIINIDCKDQNFASQYGGIWLIYSISHVFEEGNYKNVINAYRTFKLNMKDEKKEG